MSEKTIDEEYYTCKRRVGDSVCGEKVPLVRENLRMYNRKTGILTVVCPVCSKSQMLGGVLSKSLIEKYFKDPAGDESTNTGSDADAGLLQESPDQEPPDTQPGSLESTIKTRSKHEEVAAIFASDSLSTKLLSILQQFGYRGPKYQQKNDIIKEFVDTVPMYQTAQGIHNLLVTLGGFDVKIIPLIIMRVFGSIDTQQMPTGSYPMMPGGMLPGQAWGQPFPPFAGSGATVQQLPGGQIIVIPPQPTPPQNATPIRYARDSDDDTVEEVLGKDGSVVKRIYRGGGRIREQKDESFDLLKLLVTFKEIGLFGTKSTDQDRDNQIAQLVQKIDSRMDQIRGEMVLNRGTDPEVSDLKRKIEEMIEERQKIRQEELGSVIGDLRTEIAGMKAAAARPHHPIEIDGKSSDHQYEIQTKAQTFQVMSSTMENLGLKILDPLIELNKSQAKMNAVLMMRTLEQQDGAAPGSYMSVLAPISAPSREEIEATKQKWALKRQQGNPEGGAGAVTP